MSVLDKVLLMLGVREDEEYDEESLEEMDDIHQLPNQKGVAKQRKDERTMRKSNLVSLDGGAKETRVIIIEPAEFEEVRAYVDHLKNKNPLIIRLAHLDVDEARRIVDFMSGATYAIDGNMRKLGDMIFFFAPHSVVIEGELGTSIFELEGYET